MNVDMSRQEERKVYGREPSEEGELSDQLTEEKTDWLNQDKGTEEEEQDYYKYRSTPEFDLRDTTTRSDFPFKGSSLG